MKYSPFGLWLAILLAGNLAAFGQANLTGLAPVRNARVASPTTHVAVTADQNFANNATTTNAIRVFSAQAGGKKAGTASVSGNTLTFDPETHFKPGETIFTTVTSASGLTKPLVYQFTTTAAPAPGIFPAGSEVAVGRLPRSVAAADVDGDGDLDFLVANFDNGSVSVRLNDGAGSFLGGSEVAVGNQPISLVAADVDGDGDLDFLAANYSDNHVSIRFNDGTGAFSGSTSVVVGTQPTGVAVSDIDGDGDLDLLAANQVGNSVSVRFNDGTGVFSGSTEVAVGVLPQSVAAADVDGDGDLDIVTANLGTNNVSVRLNDGTGSYSGSIEISVGIHPQSVAVADVDGDGDLDLLTASYDNNSVSVRLNDGSGIFSGSTEVMVGSNPVNVATADVDGDGDLDILTANQGSDNLSVRFNNGTGSFSGSTDVAVGDKPYSVAAADLDGDGDLDLLTANLNSRSVSVRLNRQPLPLLTGVSPVRNARAASLSTNVAVTADQNFANNVTTTNSIRVFSAQTGGKKAGAAIVSGSTLTFNPATDFKPGETIFTSLTQASGLDKAHVYQFTTAAAPSPGTFFGSANVAVGSKPSGVVAADVDGDGDLDILTANYDNDNVSVRLNDGTGTFSAGSEIAVSDRPSGVVAADVDGDGDLDFLVANQGSNNVSVRFNDGSGFFSGTTEVAVFGNPSSVAAADVDGDGDLDFLTANPGTNGVSVRLNDGGGSFSGNTEVIVGGQPASVVAADVDGDGDLDFLTANPNSLSNSVSVRINDGTGVFSGSTNVAVGNGPQSVVAADVDGDGDLDFLTANLYSHNVSVWINDGMGSFSGSSEVAVGNNPASVMVADLDGDGDLDILTANQSSNNVSVRINDGSGVFSGSTNVAVGLGPQSIAVADVDGDGDLDFLTANSTGNSVSVRLNREPLPMLTGVSPARNARTANWSTNVAATATRNFVNNATTANSIRVFSAQAGGKKSGTASVSGPTLTFNPAIDFKPGETVFTTVDSASGLNKPHVYQFTTAVKPSTSVFEDSTRVTVGAGPFSVVSADVDGDGDLDLLTANYDNNTVSVRFNDGAGVFSGSTNVAVGDKPTSVAAADVDGDGDLDFLATNNFGGTVSVRFNNGAGVFSGSTEVAVDVRPFSVAAADVDGDGDLDLLTANHYSATVSVRFNDGAGSFSGGSEVAVGDFSYCVVAADVDGDGDLDFLAANFGSDNVSVRFNDGTGSFSGGPDVAVGRLPYSVATADVDGDGDLDFLTANQGSYTVSVRLNNGAGYFSVGSEVPVDYTPNSVVAADVEGDGDPDFLTSNYFGNSVSVRYNNGAGVFSGSTNVAVGIKPSSVAVADVDGDGDLDFLAANYSDNTVSVRLNRDGSVTTTAVSTASAVYGSTSVNLVATVTPFPSGGTVEFFLAGFPSNISLGTASLGADGQFTLPYNPSTLTARGYSIIANYSGAPLFAPSSGTGPLSVIKKTLTATADNKSRTYGEANPALTVTYSGFVNGDDESDLNTPPTAATSATVISHAGSYPISLNGGLDNNYDFSFVNGTLSILKASLTATADNKRRAYGVANPPLTISYSGFLNGDTPSGLNIPPTASTTAVLNSPAGEYSITLAGGVDNDYLFTFVNGTLLIEEAQYIPLTVTAVNQSKTYGQGNPTLTFSYSGFVDGDDASVLDTPPTASTTATAASDAGNYPITVSGGVDNRYSFVYVDATLTVNKKSLTATANNHSRVYGQANPAFTIAYSGFVNGDDESDLDTPPTASTTATVFSHAGSYPITLAGGLDNNYSFSLVNGSLLIGKATLTATADNQSRAYGVANPPLTISYSGFLNGDTPSGLNIPPTASTTAVQNSPAGDYPITLTGGVDNDYLFTLVNGTLSVGKTQLTVTAANQSKTYGQANPVLTFAYSGFANGDDETSLDTPPFISTTATTGSDAGHYPITLSGGVDDKYSFVYIDATLTINKATLTAKAANQSRTYGEANPALTVTYSGFVNGDDESDLNTLPTASTTATVISHAGNYPISVSGGLDNNYDFSFVNGTLSVLKASLIARADNQRRAYGVANPPLTISYSGFLNGDTPSGLNIPPTASTTAVQNSPAGEYPITLAGGVDNDYLFTLVNGTLSVEEVQYIPLTVTAAAKSKIYGQANPVLTFSYSGFTNGDDETSLDTPPSISTTATTGSDAGNYPITVSGGVDDKYSFVYVDAVLQVNKASLTAKADDKSRDFGQANPALTISYTGFVNGDDEVDIDTPPSATTSATTASPAGPYAITLSGGLDNNYSFVLQSGILTVLPVIPPTCSATGSLLQEFWAGVKGETIASIPLHLAPSSTSQITSFQGPAIPAGQSGDNYASRYRGYICPPSTGNYTFWITSDNEGELWLSTDANPANKQRIAFIHGGYAYSHQWTKYASQQSAPISLVAGQKYYVEALHKEGTGGDNLVVGWRLPTSAANATPVVIPGSALSPYVPGINAAPMVSLDLPQNGTIYNAGDNLMLAATASDSDGSVTQVEFFNGNTSLGVDASLPYSLLWSNMQAGTYTLTAVARDNSGAVTTSTAVTVTVLPVTPPTCSATGTILQEFWAGVKGETIASIPLHLAPSSTSQITSFQGPAIPAGQSGDNYASRYRGYICPPSTGNYTFWITSDNEGELWLSTDANPANKQRIAFIHGGYAYSHQWTKYASQQSAPISLVAGQKYYVEALHKEGTGGDNLVVGWRLPTSAANATPVVIPGSALSPYVPATARLAVEEETVELQAAPNPFSSTVTVTFQTATTGKAQLDLFNLHGVHLQSLFEQNVQAGESHRVVVDGHLLAEGLYLLRLVNGKKVSHLRVVLVR